MIQCVLGQLGRHSNVDVRHGVHASVQNMEPAAEGAPIDAASEIVVHCTCKPRSSKGWTCRTTPPPALGSKTEPLKQYVWARWRRSRLRPIGIILSRYMALCRRYSWRVRYRGLGASPSPTRTSASPTTGKYPTTALQAARRRKP
jgi:hypothetical protein